MAAAETTQGVECYGIENALKKFKFYRTPSHAVFQGNEMLYKWEDDDQERAEGVFKQNLESIHPESKSRYTVKFYDDITIDNDDNPSKKIKSNTEYSGMFRFKVGEKQDSLGNYTPNVYEKPAGKMGAGDERYMNYIETELRITKEKLQLRDQELADAKEHIQELEDDAEEDEEKGGILGQIGRAGEQHPWMQQSITDFMSLLGKFFGNNNGGPQQPEHRAMGAVNITGQTEDEVKQMFNQSITKLHGYYVGKHGQQKGDQLFSQDMARLANLTDKPMIFEMAINNLRGL